MSYLYCNINEHVLLENESEKYNAFFTKLAGCMKCYTNKEISNSVCDLIKKYCHIMALNEELNLDIMITNSPTDHCALFSQDNDSEVSMGRVNTAVLSENTNTVIIYLLEFKTSCNCCKRAIKVYILIID